MTAEIRRFEPVEIPDHPETPAAESKAAAFAASAIALGLKTLSQRAIAATKDVFTLLSIGSVFWIWCSVPDPNTAQIWSHSIYALVILAANVIVRRV
ncbi:MAG: hypothetical protein WC829_01300 [Hyphomicrobium sp.]|jgi:hypothetical protein